MHKIFGFYRGVYFYTILVAFLVPFIFLLFITDMERCLGRHAYFISTVLWLLFAYIFHVSIQRDKRAASRAREKSKRCKLRSKQLKHL